MMASVGSSDEVRRNRKEYQQQESDMVKRHQKEIRRLNEKHYQQIQNLKQEHEAEIREIEKRSHDAISERDHHYQQEIDKLRNVYRRQFQQVADDSQGREKAFYDATTEQERAQKKQSDMRFEQLNRNYHDQIRSQENKFQNDLQENREAQATGLKENRKELQDKYEGEIKDMRDDRDQEVGQLQNNYDQYRHTAESTMRDERLQHMKNMQRASNNLIHGVRQEEASAHQTEQLMREGFKDGLARERDRYDKSLNHEREAYKSAQDQFKSGVADRLTNQVDSLKKDNRNLKEARVLDQTKLKEQKERELNDISTAFQKKLDNYKDQRDNALHEANTERHDAVNKIRKDLGQQMVENSRYYRHKMGEENRIHRNAYDTLKMEDQNRAAQIADTADNRIKGIIQDRAEETQRMNELNKTNHTTTQESYEDQMNAIRDKIEGEKNAAVRRLRDRLEKESIDHSKQLADVQRKFQKEIQGLKDRIVHDHRESDLSLKRTIQQMQKAHDMSVTQLEAQNRDKVNRLNAEHAAEIQSLNRRHEAKLDELAGEMKKT